VNCELIWREVSNYIDDEVDLTLRSTMEAHFKTCAHCKSVLEGARNVIQVYGDERMLAETTGEQTIAVPVGYSRRLEKRLAQNARANRSRWSFWTPRWTSRWTSRSMWLIPVAAVALLAIGLRWANLRTQTPPLSAGHDVRHDVQHDVPPNHIPPDLVVVVSTDTASKLFHVAGCHLIHDQNKVRSLTAKEAIEQGYTPCTQCLRKYLNVTENRGPGSGDGHDADDKDHDDDQAAKADLPIRGEGR
jgi:hypothetical protein